MLMPQAGDGKTGEEKKKGDRRRESEKEPVGDAESVIIMGREERR